jgi:hypothetical protein
MGPPRIGNVELLNKEQRRAFEIVMEHAQLEKEGKHTDQLLMTVIRPCVMGKTTSINTVTEAFESMGIAHWLAKTVTSGVAASLSGGNTLHWWAGIPV